MREGAIGGSFRDPSGFVFERDGVVYRQVNQAYRDHYEHLMGSGLYDALVEAGLLVQHRELGREEAVTDQGFTVVEPEPVGFISYPYEWCFSQLKDAALATLEIQRAALDFGMILKDASAYNIQYVAGQPVLIDTLSFEKYLEGQIWVGYRQFCQHFFAPLALMSFRDIRLGQLLRVNIDGIPLDLASELLPARTWLRFSLLSHIHLHARTQKRYAGSSVAAGSRRMSPSGLLGLVGNLESAIKGMEWRPGGTEWGDYYEDTSYAQEGLAHKRVLVSEFLDEVNCESVWDLGANTGMFSRVASDKGIGTIAFDVDPAAVELNYRESVRRRDSNLLPLLLDLTNPSSRLGWANSERMSLEDRGPAEVVMALALVHHLAIGNNVPLGRIAKFFAGICNWLVIEFVPKSDPQVQRLLASREDIFSDYTSEAFEAEFSTWFTIRRKAEIRGMERTVYLMERCRARR